MESQVVTIGTFDGVHRGHQNVLAQARDAAERAGVLSVAYTFDVPPRAARGGPSPLLLLPPETKRVLLTRWVDRVVEASFAEVRDLSARDFVRDVLRRDLRAGTVVVGESFRFGAGRSADVEALRALAAESTIGVTVVPSLVVAGDVVSSTRIRNLLSAGDLERATALLGRPPILRGRTLPGDAIGRTLGFPTANLDVDPRVLLPKHGIYLSRAFAPGIRSVALTYIGRRPTLRDSAMRCEVHLLSPPDRELAGETLEVHLYRWLRADRRFPTLAALRAQMQLDLTAASREAQDFPDAADPDPVGG